MPIYDRSDLVEMFDKAMTSILKNTLKPDEIIIVVDGPISSIFEEKIKFYEDMDIVKVLWLKVNSGITTALNEGLKIISNPLVFRADGDDINHRLRFEIQHKLLVSGFDIVGGAIREVDSNGVQLSIKRLPKNHQDIINFASRRCPFNHMTVAFKLRHVRQVGGYPNIISDNGLCEDWALWVLLLKSGCKAVNSEKILVNALTDISMYKRRGGFDNLKSEFRIQKFLISHLNKNLILVFFDIFLRAIFFLVSPRLRGAIYKIFLRDQI